MGQHIGELKKERNKLAQQILDRIKTWDESGEHAAEIIEENNPLIEKLKDLDSQMKAINPEDLYDKNYESSIEEILHANKNLFKKIARDKESILKSIKQTSKSKEVLNSYVTNFDESIFINKDI